MNFCVYLCVSTQETGYRIIRCYCYKPLADEFIKQWNMVEANQQDLLHVEAHQLYQTLDGRSEP